ncbi:hypothetical protein LNA02_20970 [Levilactobacillus namurensis]|nr:hypothetical protein LNA02_20970 [Levilactobacillus namurensis]
MLRDYIVLVTDYYVGTCCKVLQGGTNNYGLEYFKRVIFDNVSEFSGLSQVSRTDVYFVYRYLGVGKQRVPKSIDPWV